MDKVMVEVYVPILENKYNVFIPVNKNIQAVIQLLNKAIYEMTNGVYSMKSSLLCDKETGNIFDLNKNVKDAGIKNGTKLILI